MSKQNSCTQGSCYFNSLSRETLVKLVSLDHLGSQESRESVGREVILVMMDSQGLLYVEELLYNAKLSD